MRSGLIALVVIIVLSVWARSHYMQNRVERTDSVTMHSTGECSTSLDEFAGLNCKHQGTERQCMVCNTYFEAGILHEEGQLAVGANVMTRRFSDRFPNTLCGVIYQHAQYSWTARKLAILPKRGEIGYGELCQAAISGTKAMHIRPSGHAFYLLGDPPKRLKKDVDAQKRALARANCSFAENVEGHWFYDCPGIITVEQLAAAARQVEGTSSDDDVRVAATPTPTRRTSAQSRRPVVTRIRGKTVAHRRRVRTNHQRPESVFVPSFHEAIVPITPAGDARF